MKNTFGNTITLTVFGESHGECIGGVLDGLPPGLEVDMDYILKEMSKRKSVSAISTPRHEEDIPVFISGVRDGYTEGTPAAFLIANKNVRSADYKDISSIARPGHADYTAQMKYLGYQDTRGGGHFSGRLTAVLVAAGAVIRKALEARGIYIATHIAELAGIEDDGFDPDDLRGDIYRLNEADLAVLSSRAGEKMIARVMEAREDGDSVGGVLETIIYGVEAGIGEPVFGSIESELASAMFGIGAVKGIEFGAGFGLARMTGSEANDQMMVQDGRVVTLTNNNGGINGGISNGMPIVFRTVIKPTPSISKAQKTVDYVNMTDAELSITGRHDPAIVHRARAVQDAVSALVTADLICQRYGYMWLAGNR